LLVKLLLLLLLLWGDLTSLGRGLFHVLADILGDDIKLFHQSDYCDLHILEYLSQFWVG
jgi:hypothetical protein